LGSEETPQLLPAGSVCTCPPPPSLELLQFWVQRVRVLGIYKVLGTYHSGAKDEILTCRKEALTSWHTSKGTPARTVKQQNTNKSNYVPPQSPFATNVWQD